MTDINQTAPTATPGLDLDAVGREIASVLEGADRYPERSWMSLRDALRNTAPTLIAEVRALRAKLAEAKRLGLEACRASGAAPGGAVYAQIAAIAAAMEAL